jgi:putative superfamily III holin-X
MGAVRIPQLLKQTATDFQRLAKLEAQLVSERVKPQVRRKGVAVGMGVGALILVRLALLFLLAGATAALALALPVWAAILVMGGGLLLIGGVLGLLAARGLRGGGSQVSAGARDQLKRDIEWIRDNSG